MQGMREPSCDRSSGGRHRRKDRHEGNDTKLSEQVGSFIKAYALGESMNPDMLCKACSFMTGPGLIENPINHDAIQIQCVCVFFYSFISRPTIYRQPFKILTIAADSSPQPCTCGFPNPKPKP